MINRIKLRKKESVHTVRKAPGVPSNPKQFLQIGCMMLAVALAVGSASFLRSLSETPIAVVSGESRNAENENEVVWGGTVEQKVSKSGGEISATAGNEVIIDDSQEVVLSKINVYAGGTVTITKDTVVTMERIRPGIDTSQIDLDAGSTLNLHGTGSALFRTVRQQRGHQPERYGHSQRKVL